MAKKKRIRKAVLPVGGLGTRFLPATKAMPKEMMPILDRPLIHYAVQEALDAGIEEFVFITARGKTSIVDYFDNAFELNTALLSKNLLDELEEVNSLVLQPGQYSYIRQQEPLGLGHAIWCARHFVGNEPFAVLLADDLIMAERPCLQQLVEAYNVRSGNMVAVMDVPKDQTLKYGILDIQKEESHIVSAKGIVEKPLPEKAPSTLAVIGRYILEPEIFEALSGREKDSRGEIQLTDGLDAMIRTHPLYGVRFIGKRFDCGSKQGFFQAILEVALSHPEIKDFAKEEINRLANQNWPEHK